MELPKLLQVTLVFRYMSRYRTIELAAGGARARPDRRRLLRPRRRGQDLTAPPAQMTLGGAASRPMLLGTHRIAV